MVKIKDEKKNVLPREGGGGGEIIYISHRVEPCHENVGPLVNEIV